MKAMAREWREATDLKPATVWLAVTLAVAALLRVWALGHGLPFSTGVDEPQVMNRVLHMMRTGDLNPHFFDYPSLVFYLHLPVACLRFLHGAMQGSWSHLDQISDTDLILWGRALTAAFGVATVVVVHQIGMRWGARHALLAAGLMTVMPLHVRESHYALTDVPMTFFSTMALLFSLRASEQARWPAFALAGALAGLATATKYTAGVTVVLPMIAAWSTFDARPSRVACLGAALGSFAAAFLAAAPYTLLDLPGFLNGFAYLVAQYHQRPPTVDPGWLIYLKHLRIALGWPGALLAAGGLVFGIVRAFGGPGRLRWALLVIFPVVFVSSLGNTQPIHARYLLPIVPFLCVLVAAAVVSGVSLLRRFDIPRAPRTILIVGLTVAALLPPLLTSVAFTRSLSRETTSAVAYRWLLGNLPAGAHVVIERADVRLPGQRYVVEHVKTLTDRPLDRYRAEGVDYLIATSQVFRPLFDSPGADPAAREAYRGMLAQAREIARFSPTRKRPGVELIVLSLRD
jgi:4-amino-4-deoxy-L-arabinose transferase-like glycosyltransferase